MENENILATFYIEENTPSSKNGRVWTGKHFIPSAYTRKWLKKTKDSWIRQSIMFREATRGLPKPFYIEFTFIRKTRHRFDYINIAQAPQDQMKVHGWIEDDDASNLKPYFGDFEYNKHNPGLRIIVLKTKPNHYDLQTHTRASRGILPKYRIKSVLYQGVN